MVRQEGGEVNEVRSDETDFRAMEQAAKLAADYRRDMAAAPRHPTGDVRSRLFEDV